MTDISIHPVGVAEQDVVLTVYRQCQDFLALGPQPRASLEMVQADMELSRQQGGVFCGIYNAQGEMIGVVDFILAESAHRPQAHLSLLMIARPYRDQGVGAEVVRQVEQLIRQNPHARSICAGVQVNNPAAVRFWQKMGYRIVGGPEAMPDQTTVYHLRKDLQ